MSLLRAAYDRLWTLPSAVKDLTGRTVIVTGSNIGLGFEAAKSFYAMNPARLILAVRDTSKGETAKREILESPPRQNDSSSPKIETSVEVWKLDLASFKSVVEFGKRCEAELDRLDIMIENAGVAGPPFALTEDGWETALQINVLSTFLLAAMLMPLLEKTSRLPPPIPNVVLKPHLAIVASGVHASAKFPERSASHILSALSDEKTFGVLERYQTTKLLDVMLTRELGKDPLFQETKVVLTSLTPGFCRSELMRRAPWPFRWMLYTFFARSTQEGSKTLVWGGLQDDVPPGSYNASCTVARPAPFVLSAEGAEVQKRLWKEVGEVVSKFAPETKSVFGI